jgi:hypothetical protein
MVDPDLALPCNFKGFPEPSDEYRFTPLKFTMTTARAAEPMSLVISQYIFNICMRLHVVYNVNSTIFISLFDESSPRATIGRQSSTAARSPPVKSRSVPPYLAAGRCTTTTLGISDRSVSHIREPSSEMSNASAEPMVFVGSPLAILGLQRCIGVCVRSRTDQHGDAGGNTHEWYFHDVSLG